MFTWTKKDLRNTTFGNAVLKILSSERDQLESPCGISEGRAWNSELKQQGDRKLLY